MTQDEIDAYIAKDPAFQRLAQLIDDIKNRRPVGSPEFRAQAARIYAEREARLAREALMTPEELEAELRRRAEEFGRQMAELPSDTVRRR